MSNTKTKKRCRHQKRVSNSKEKEKKTNKKAPLSIVHNVRLRRRAAIRAAVRHRRSWCCWSLRCCWVRVLVAASRGHVGAGRCFAGSCCCQSSLLVVVAAGSGCWFAAVLFLFVAAALFKIYYRVGLGRVRPTPTAKKT